MTVTGNSSSTAIVTYRGTPLSMDDSYVKVIPKENSTDYEVYGVFFGTDSTYGFPGVTGAVRKAAQEWLEDVLTAVGRPSALMEVDGPLGKRLIVPSSRSHTGTWDLVDPFANKTYQDVYLTNVTSDDSGGRMFKVTWTFTKPKTAAGDGTDDSALSWGSVKIGNRGGKVTTKIGESTIDVTAVSYYVKTVGGQDFLTYIADLSNSIKLAPSATIAVPRGAQDHRSVHRTYTTSAVDTLTCTGSGSLQNCICKSIDCQEDTPGVLTINTTFSATR